MMDTGKVYIDIDGEKRTIMQMVREEPYWAANRVQEGERAIANVAELTAEKEALKDDAERYRTIMKYAQRRLIAGREYLRLPDLHADHMTDDEAVDALRGEGE